MIYKKVLLKDIDSRFKDSPATLLIYISERNESTELRPGMLVCPGGAYVFCSPREGEPIAFRYLSEGFNCFILDYSTHKKYPVPQLELAAAFSYIRSHEKEFDLLPNSLSIAGFSAGGHLVGSYGLFYKEFAKELKINDKMLRPLSIVMGYPVTVMNADTHQETRDTITGGEEELKTKLSIPNHITKDYPPTFVWATKDDQLVPYQNTALLYEALKKNKVLSECHIFESGWHGASLANRSCYRKGEITKKMKDIRDWVSLSADFIFNILDK